MSNKAHSDKQPLMHIVKRDSMPWWKSWLIRIAAVFAGLIVCGLISYLLTKENPLKIYLTMIDGSFGTERRRWNLLYEVSILLAIALAVTPAFKMKFWNIGAEGQVLVGGLASAACMILIKDSIPSGALIAIMFVCSILAGILWALLPAICKAIWNTNETLFTLMMNYIAMQLIAYFSFIWSVPKGAGQIGVINGSTKSGWLPVLHDQRYLLIVIIITILTALMFVYLKYTKHGYEISVVGESENTARYIGINVKKVIIRTLVISGAIAGFVGFLIVAGVDHTVNADTAGGQGFTAIMVSWLAKFNPLYMILTAFLIVFFKRGATEITTVFPDLNESFAEIITGIIIFFIIGCEFFINYKVVFRGSKPNQSIYPNIVNGGKSK